MNTEPMNEQSNEPRETQTDAQARPDRDMELTEQFTRVAWLLTRYRLHNYMTHGPMGDPHRGQGRVLSLLKLKPEISQKELSYLLDMRPQSLGELLAKLERNGYITRTPSASDRRVVEIKLTEAGAKVANETDQESVFAALFDTLSKEEQATLSDLLARLIARFEEELGDEPERGDFGWRKRWGGRQPFGSGDDWSKGGPHRGPFGPHGKGHGRMPFDAFDARERLRGLRGQWARWQHAGAAE